MWNREKLSRKANLLQHVNYTLSFIFSIYNLDKVVFVNYPISTFVPHSSKHTSLIRKSMHCYLYFKNTWWFIFDWHLDHVISFWSHASSSQVWQLITSKWTHNCTIYKIVTTNIFRYESEQIKPMITEWMLKYRKIQIWATVPLSTGIPLHYKTHCFNEESY